MSGAYMEVLEEMVASAVLCACALPFLGPGGLPARMAAFLALFTLPSSVLGSLGCMWGGEWRQDRRLCHFVNF